MIVTERLFFVIVDGTVEWSGNSVIEATEHYGKELAEAYEGDDVILQERTYTYEVLQAGVGTKPYPPFDPNAPVVPLHSLLPEVSVQRGGINFATPSNEREGRS